MPQPKWVRSEIARTKRLLAKLAELDGHAYSSLAADHATILADFVISPSQTVQYAEHGYLIEALEEQIALVQD